MLGGKLGDSSSGKKLPSGDSLSGMIVCKGDNGAGSRPGCALLSSVLRFRDGVGDWLPSLRPLCERSMEGRLLALES